MKRHSRRLEARNGIKSTLYLLPEAAAVPARNVDGLHVVVPLGIGVAH